MTRLGKADFARAKNYYKAKTMQGVRDKLLLARRFEKAGIRALTTVSAIGIMATVIGILYFSPAPKSEVSVSLALPPDPWQYFIHCTCDSATFCLSDEDYMHIVAYNEALKNTFYLGVQNDRRNSKKY